MSKSPNTDQIAYWNSEAGTRWAVLQERLDAQFADLTDAALDHAGPRAGDRVLDVGCGCGATVLALAGRVGPRGTVVGVDVSRPMLDVAAQRVRAGQLPGVTLLLADASTHPFEPGAFDLAFSRFGVMFFDDPVQAFANIRRPLAGGGRLSFACWRRMSENPFFLVPFVAAKPYLPPQPPADPEAPGPFAFADEDRVGRILNAAGFSAIEVVRHDPMIRLGGAAAAADLATQMGPVARLLAEAEAGVKAAAQAAILEEFTRHEGPDGILLPGSVWLVSARA